MVSAGAPGGEADGVGCGADEGCAGGAVEGVAGTTGVA
jgi:hypothetical protein